MTDRKSKKPARPKSSWKALVAVDRVTGDYLCGYVEWPRGKSTDEFYSYVGNYNRPIIRHATLTLSPPKKERK